MGNIEEIHFREGEFELSVRVEPQADTVWLNRQQMAQLFDRDIKTIGKHIQSALREELDNSTVAKFATVQLEGSREVERQVEYYNLDMIISVGYRVKSARGVQFRRWATNVLRQYLMQGYVCQQKRLQDLSTTIRVMKRVENKLDSAQILEVVQQYTRSLDLLDDYDHQRLKKPQGDTHAYVLTYEECRKLIDSMRYGDQLLKHFLGLSPFRGKDAIAVGFFQHLVFKLWRVVGHIGSDFVETEIILPFGISRHPLPLPAGNRSRPSGIDHHHPIHFLVAKGAEHSLS